MKPSRGAPSGPLSQSLTLQYDNIRFMIDPSEFAQAANGANRDISIRRSRRL